MIVVFEFLLCICQKIYIRCFQYIMRRFKLIIDWEMPKLKTAGEVNRLIGSIIWGFFVKFTQEDFNRENPNCISEVILDSIIH
jgi:hypothetical protein